MANTIGTTSLREKYFKGTLEQALRNALVAEKICSVDRSDSRLIKNPYGSAPTATVQALAGTYTPATFTVTDDSLTVTDEVIVSEHIYGFEDILNSFDLYSARMDELMYSVANKIDRYVLNYVLEAGTGTYSTPAGGFDAANINDIMSNLISKVAGYSDVYRGMALVIENTEVPGFVKAQATNGFSFADAALNNGFMTRYMGVDVYVVRSGTFADETLGTQTYTNAGHRLFMVKGVATYATPRNIQYEEKSVSGKTGKEIVVAGLLGAKLWAPKASLVVDVTIVA